MLVCTLLRCWCSFSSCRHAVFAPPTLWTTGNDPEMGVSCSRSAQIGPSRLSGTGLMVLGPTANETLVLWGQKRLVVCALFEGQTGGCRRCVQGRWCESTIPNPNTEVRGNGACQWAQARNPATPFVSRGVSRVFIPVCWGVRPKMAFLGSPDPHRSGLITQRIRVRNRP